MFTREIEGNILRIHNSLRRKKIYIYKKIKIKRGSVFSEKEYIKEKEGER